MATQNPGIHRDLLLGVWLASATYTPVRCLHSRPNLKAFQGPQDRLDIPCNFCTASVHSSCSRAAPARLLLALRLALQPLSSPLACMALPHTTPNTAPTLRSNLLQLAIRDGLGSTDWRQDKAIFWWVLSLFAPNSASYGVKLCVFGGPWDNLDRVYPVVGYVVSPKGTNRNDPLSPAILDLGNHAKLCVLTSQNMFAMCQIGGGICFWCWAATLGRGTEGPQKACPALSGSPVRIFFVRTGPGKTSVRRTGVCPHPVRIFFRTGGCPRPVREKNAKKMRRGMRTRRGQTPVQKKDAGKTRTGVPDRVRTAPCPEKNADRVRTGPCPADRLLSLPCPRLTQGQDRARQSLPGLFRALAGSRLKVPSCEGNICSPLFGICVSHSGWLEVADFYRTGHFYMFVFLASGQGSF